MKLGNKVYSYHDEILINLLACSEHMTYRISLSDGYSHINLKNTKPKEFYYFRRFLNFTCDLFSWWHDDLASYYCHSGNIGANMISCKAPPHRLHLQRYGEGDSSFGSADEGRIVRSRIRCWWNGINPILHLVLISQGKFSPKLANKA